MGKKSLYNLRYENEVCHISLVKSVKLEEAKEYIRLFDRRNFKNIKKIVLDFSDVEVFDTFVAILHNSFIKHCAQWKIEYEAINLSQSTKDLLNTIEKKHTYIVQEVKEPNKIYQYVSNLGANVVVILEDLYKLVEFIGELFLKSLSVFIKPTEIRWKDFPYYLNRAGVNALPIIILILFLIGVISGYQGALQLKQFGADIYIANLVGISVARELGPLMTAVIVAGRSGAGFAAEIGTMKVSDEIDALKTIGYDVVKFLVMPRILAVMVAMPILTIISDIAGVIGGLVSAYSTLNITIFGYLNQLQTALSLYDIFTGLIKSIVFGFIISVIGCYRGLSVTGGADTVGKYTTSAVVTSIFFIIFFDAIFTFLFQAIGI